MVISLSPLKRVLWWFLAAIVPLPVLRVARLRGGAGRPAEHFGPELLHRRLPVVAAVASGQQEQGEQPRSQGGNRPANRRSAGLAVPIDGPISGLEHQDRFQR